MGATSTNHSYSFSIPHKQVVKGNEEARFMTGSFVPSYLSVHQHALIHSRLATHLDSGNRRGMTNQYETWLTISVPRHSAALGKHCTG
jgi:hypothetical protein